MDGFTKLVELQNQAWAIYRDSYFVIPGAPPEFRDLIDATTTVQNVIKLVDSAVIDATHPLSSSGPDAIHNVVAMCNAIQRTLEGVEKLVSRYRKVAGPATDLAGLSSKLWGKLKWAVEKKAVVEFSARLRMHTRAVNLSMAVISGATPEQIDAILEELFDEIDEHRQKRVYEGIKLQVPAIQEAVKRGLVELPTEQPIFVELDSREIPRPMIQNEVPVLAADSSLPEVDVNKMRLAEADPAELNEKQVAEESGLELILQHEGEEKIVVDQIMMQAERFLAQQGFSKPSLNRRKTRRNIYIPKFNPTMVDTTQVPVIDQPMAITYMDLPPSYSIYSKMDIIGTDFNPGAKICETFRLEAAHNLNTPDWPKSTEDWLRIAAWWLLKCRVAVDTVGVSQQTFVDWAKSSWILTEVVPPTPQQQAAMERDLQLAYTELWQQMKLLFLTHQASQMQQFTPTLEALNILEAKQVEEESHDPDPVILMDLFEALVTPDPHVRARCFVALEFGVIRPADAFAATIDVHYLLLLAMDPRTQEVRITIYNQFGTVCVHSLLRHSDFSTEMIESNAHVWLEVDWNQRTIFAGFSSVQASLRYATARNWVRRQLLERPRAIFSVDVERVRYLKEGGQMATAYSAASGWIGSANLKLMEMRRAEDEHQRYREIVVEGHFTTCNIPYHSIKMVPTGSNRITVFWPTFETPSEDLRDYINAYIKPKKHLLKNFYAGRDQIGLPADDEWFMSHHIRHHSKSVTCHTNSGVLNVDIKFRPMKDRRCDIETSRQSERMIDILFHNTSDLQKFVRDFGGTAPWSTTETLIFHRTSATHKVYLFRELDGTVRLCFSQEGMYCNFFLDSQSGYFIDPTGNFSLWNLIWSPAANITREVGTYLPDSLSLPMLDRSSVEDFITALFPSQTIAIIPITYINGRKKSLFLSSRTMSCSSATLLIVRTFSPKSNTHTVRFVICGNITFPYYSTDPPLKEMRKIIAIVPPEYHWETAKAREKILVRFKGTNDVLLRSFSRERSQEKPVVLLAGSNQEVIRKIYAALCWAMEFVVEEREWDYAMAVMGVQRSGVGGKKGIGSLVLGAG